MVNLPLPGSGVVGGSGVVNESGVVVLVVLAAFTDVDLGRGRLVEVDTLDSLGDLVDDGSLKWTEILGT